MKPYIKFAFIVCCAAVVPLLSSRAATIQVQVGAGGAKFYAISNVTIKRGRYGRVDLGGNNHSSDLGDTRESQWVMGLWRS